jgi:Ca2+:H+ antiporter
MSSAPLLPRSSLQEPRPVHFDTDPDFKDSLKALCNTNLYFNIVIAIFFPLGILAGSIGWSDSITFITNMVAIIGLAKMLDLTTEQLSLRLGQTLGALVNASFGNAVELIVSIMALREGLVVVVQSSLLGSILSNLLFVLGFCFYMGGLKYTTQKFSNGAANVSSSLLAITILVFLLPAAFGFQLPDSPENATKQLYFSHGTSVLMLVIYIAFLYFQLSTHKHLFVSEVEEEDEVLLISIPVASSALVIATVLIGVSAEFLVGSIEGISHEFGLSQTFIGMIILPIIGNAAGKFELM